MLICEQSDALSQIPEIKHGFFKRHGGVSAGLYSSLNCGFGSHDDRNCVEQNRERVSHWLNIKPQNLHTLMQVHGNNVHVVNQGAEALSKDGDGLVTASAGIAVGVLTADCVPVLFADPYACVVGVAHAGWQGALHGVVGAVVDSMICKGASRESIVASLGPAIAQASYQVKEDFITKIRRHCTFDIDQFIVFKNDEIYFDLPKFVVSQCYRAGIQEVDNLAIDTYTSDQEYFSYRRSCHNGESDYGRQISVIMIES